MSLIISYIKGNNAFVFSEGRLTTNISVEQDDFDKTIALFDGKVICAFCGAVKLNDINNNIIDIGTIIKEIALYEPDQDFEKFLSKVEHSIKVHFKRTFNATSPTQIHFIRKINDTNGKFQFNRIAFLKDDNSEIKVDKSSETTKYNFWIDGDPDALKAAYAELTGKSDVNSMSELIIFNKRAIEMGIKSSFINEHLIAVCGGETFHQTITLED